ncbi:MAG: undecaprenyldiphospho-muramoylpentapeptide beta-N-acetylglucosaminyltransferase [Acidobacteriota bacterium]
MHDTSGAYVIAAGKTGGHIFPGIALAREIRRRRPDAPIVFVGTAEAGGLETRLVPEAGFPLERVHAAGFVGKPLFAKARALAGLPRGFFEARRILRRHRARAVAGMGGYVSLPVLAAARSLRIPTLIHDSDALPGLASRILNRFATRTALGLAAARDRMTRPASVTGTPVRPEFFEIPPVDAGATGRRARLLVFGGSQGSVVLNRAVAKAAAGLAGDPIDVLHQTGEKHLAATRALYGSLPAGWTLEPFLPRLWEPLGNADLVVARAGAMTLAELAAAGRGAVLVPFAAAAHGHQLVNALAFSREGAAEVIREGELDGDGLADAIRRLIADRPRLAAMGAAARALAAPDAAARLADLLFEAEAPAGAGGAA